MSRQTEFQDLQIASNLLKRAVSNGEMMGACGILAAGRTDVVRLYCGCIESDLRQHVYPGYGGSHERACVRRLPRDQNRTSIRLIFLILDTHASALRQSIPRL